MKIWKQFLQRQRVQDIAIPSGAEIISVGYKDEGATIWFKCDPEAAPEMRRIEICYTGADDVPEDGKFIGTVIKPTGIVLHVFEISLGVQGHHDIEFR